MPHAWRFVFVQDLFNIQGIECDGYIKKNETH